MSLAQELIEPLLGDARELAAEGFATQTDIDAAMRLGAGHAKGPFELMAGGAAPDMPRVDGDAEAPARAAVIGTGTMATGIAEVLARAGAETEDGRGRLAAPTDHGRAPALAPLHHPARAHEPAHSRRHPPSTEPAPPRGRRAAHRSRDPKPHPGLVRVRGATTSRFLSSCHIVKHEFVFCLAAGTNVAIVAGAPAWNTNFDSALDEGRRAPYPGLVAASEPLIRPPLQRRSQESLERVLQAGLEVLQEQGFDGFTLQEVSTRAGVSIGSIYARVASREALIMAIYERTMAWTEENEQLERDSLREDLSPRERIETIVTDMANNMLGHADILRVFMRQAPINPDIWQRGAEKSHETSKVFERAILEHREEINHPEPDLAVDVAWRMVYCTIARRITHGPKFESPRTVSDRKLVRELARAVADYLL